MGLKGLQTPTRGFTLKLKKFNIFITFLWINIVSLPLLPQVSFQNFPETPEPCFVSGVKLVCWGSGGTITKSPMCRTVHATADPQGPMARPPLPKAQVKIFPLPWQPQRKGRKPNITCFSHSCFICNGFILPLNHEKCFW